jgi:putative two-component system response regulator
MIADRLPQARILMVDDEASNLDLLRRILETAGFSNVRSTTNPCEVLDLCEEWDPDLLLLDILMPDMDGFTILEKLNQGNGETTYLPVLVLTSDHSSEVRRRALSSGARDFLNKPLSPSDVRLRVRNLLETRFLHLELRERNRDLEERVRERTAELERARYEILRRLARAAEYRDDDTGDHTRRVGETSAAIARAYGVDDDEVELIRRIAPLHDVGKIAIPDSILLHPGPLDEGQRQVMRTHTVIGGDMLGGSGFELLDRASEIAMTHHEHWDGSGYPLGLAGEAISLAGRIVKLADTFDALTHLRPYKAAWAPETAWSWIQRSAGTVFDPALVEAADRVLGEGARGAADEPALGDDAGIEQAGG